MSLRSKKMSLPNLKKCGNVQDNGAAKVQATPTRSADGISNTDKVKPKSSMKKLKNFFKDHSKKKQWAADSPSVNHLRQRQGQKDRSAGAAAHSLPGVEPKQKVEVNHLPNSQGHETKVSKRVLSNAKSPQGYQADDQPSKRRRLDKVANHVADSAAFVSKVKRGAASSSSLSMPQPLASSDSYRSAENLFKTMIDPVSVQKFFSEMWERKPLLIRRHNPHYNDGWFTCEELDRILREETVKFGENIDVVTYLNGKRETHNPEGRAYAPVVWDFFQNGCSVRLLNPHTYSKSVWSKLSQLQEYFSCVAGANIYLTPAGSQGFAPHWDDIEAFVLQLEGQKHWRVYEPRNDSETLPRFSSENFTDEDLPAEPVLDAVLEAGDMLYFPRGYIHQASTVEGIHSLHITVSVGQKNTWGDLLEKLLPRAVQLAMEEDVEFRRSLPHNYLNYMGVAFSDESNPERNQFMKTVQRLFSKLLPHAPVDAACDQMAKEFLQNSLPPVINDEERRCSVHGNGEHWDPVENRVRGAVEIEPDTEIKLLRRGSIRLVTEDDKVFICHNFENGRLLHSEECHSIAVEPEMAEGVEFLLKNYPDYVPVDELPLDTVQDRVALAVDLYDRGLVATREPLSPMSGDDDSCCSDHTDCS